MRKLHQVMIAAAAAGGLSAIGAGTSVAYDATPSVSDLYRPYQECSPQTVAATDVPVAVLGLSETFDTTCGQFNNAFTG
ncbi:MULTISPECIES: hypothetical protein [Streptomyces]|uniref:Uncharacterized protein n=1 Tax=Streptomyces ferrugineus TaxID=1413221 RepID=A0A7M2SM88_9ACTN|nr:hypothetical protein [Streptomyces ferrugineus]QOV37476.1 hypothetical protein IM697_03295 [Streptomyces ferrugineus]WSU50968.1 hypothetical protein OG254_22610 [Streptomyces sp. NBC_01092]